MDLPEIQQSQLIKELEVTWAERIKQEDLQYVKKMVDSGKYYGYSRQGKRYGPGTFISERVKYEGEWRDDKYNGKGFLVKNGVTYDCNFINGQPTGHGTQVQKTTGRLYVGEFKDGKP